MAVTCTAHQRAATLLHMSSQPQSQPTHSSKKNVDYKKGGYTESIILWLEQNPEHRRQLFSDNVQEASAEGRRAKTGKHPKLHYYSMIAQAIFAHDETHQAVYTQDPM